MNIFYKIYKRFRYLLKKIVGTLTKEIRMLPDFIIIGGSRSGNSTLYTFITKHPYIGRALKQEVHFFDAHFNRGINWYRSFFPTLARKFLIETFCKHKFITGEATPLYLFYPSVPKRISSLLPKLKIIILLRNPTDRAYARYLVYKKKQIGINKNYLSFKKKIKISMEKLNQGLFNSCNDEKYDPNFIKESIFARGVYVDQIKRWREYFPKEQFLIIKSEDFFNNTPKILKEIFKFLNLPYWKNRKLRTFKSQNLPELDPKIRKEVFDLYEPHNQRLYKFLSLNLHWK